jgi:hypothetical protein
VGTDRGEDEHGQQLGVPVRASGTDPDADRTVIDRDGQRTLLVPIPSVDEAPEIARRLADEDGVGRGVRP